MGCTRNEKKNEKMKKKNDLCKTEGYSEWG
jgi:hypothetical protein